MSKEITEIDYNQYNNAGNENLKSDDFQIPHIKILEKLSPALDEIDDARAGDIYLSSTESSVKELYFVPLHYITVFTVWSEESPDKMIGTFETKTEAQTYIESLNEKASVSETGQNLLLMLDEDLEMDHPVMFYLSKSRLAVNKALNTKIKVIYPKNAPRFAGVWKLSTKTRTNTKGTWYVPKFQFHSLCSKDLLDTASTLYNDITKNLIENTFRVN